MCSAWLFVHRSEVSSGRELKMAEDDILTAPRPAPRPTAAMANSHIPPAEEPSLDIADFSETASESLVLISIMRLLMSSM